LRNLQKEHNISYLRKIEVYTPEVKEEITERITLRDRLLEKAKQTEDPNNKQTQLMENLAWMLEFHRRELKPIFWRFFDRLGLSHDELIDDAECLAQYERTGRESFRTSTRARHAAFEYRFDPKQEFKGPKEHFYLLDERTENGKQARVKYISEESNLEKGLIVLQSNEEPKTLIFLDPR